MENIYSDIFKDIDPDHYLFKSMYTDSKCVCANEVDVLKTNNKSLSIIHFNARSLKKNFHSIAIYLKNCGIKFDIIAISENWVKENDINYYNINNYQVTHLVREKKVVVVYPYML